jgi:hypothetical protein
MRPKPIRISRASRANSEPRETITGSEKGESKSESGKWASEAFGFLRFYQRVGNQLWGLILIEIGWAVLVLLIAKMLPEQGQKKIHHKSIIDIFLIGAAGLALCWCFSSGVYLYARLLLGRILSGLAALLFYLAFWVLFVLRFLFLFSELRRTRKRLRDEETAAEKKEPIEAAAEKPPASPEIEAEVKKLAKLERDKACDEKALELLDEKAKQLNAPWTLKVARTFETLALPCALGLSRLKLGGRIGLAPIYSFTFEEDRKAAKAPLQAFATGVDRLQNKLQYLVSIQLVRFEVLPPAVKVTTSRRAKMLRSVFGLDAVLWGSYVSIDPPLIAMQIETARAKPKDEKDAWIRKLEIFKGLDPIENEGIIVDQEDTLDAYVAVAMALVHALNAREFRSGGLFSKPFDRLGLYDSSNRNAIITTLVEDGLFALPAVPLKRGAELRRCF